MKLEKWHFENQTMKYPEIADIEMYYDDIRDDAKVTVNFSINTKQKGEELLQDMVDTAKALGDFYELPLEYSSVRKVYKRWSNMGGVGVEIDEEKYQYYCFFTIQFKRGVSMSKSTFCNIFKETFDKFKIIV